MLTPHLLAHLPPNYFPLAACAYPFRTAHVWCASDGHHGVGAGAEAEWSHSRVRHALALGLAERAAAGDESVGVDACDVWVWVMCVLRDVWVHVMCGCA